MKNFMLFSSLFILSVSVSAQKIVIDPVNPKLITFTVNVKNGLEEVQEVNFQTFQNVIEYLKIDTTKTVEFKLMGIVNDAKSQTQMKLKQPLSFKFTTKPGMIYLDKDKDVIKGIIVSTYFQSKNGFGNDIFGNSIFDGVNTFITNN